MANSIDNNMADNVDDNMADTVDDSNAVDDNAEDIPNLLTPSCDNSKTMAKRGRPSVKITRNADGKIECDFCDSTFTQLSSYKRHMFIHAGIKPFVCEYCDKGFRRRAVLKIHIRLHTGDKPYKCDICTLAFTSKYGLETHKKRHNAVTKKSTRKYYCKVCRKKFKSHDEKMLHHQTNDSPCFQQTKAKYIKDKISGPTTAASSFTCITCHKKFSTTKDLFNHQQGRNVITFECKHCKILFPSKTELLYHHIRSHNGEENDVICNDENNASSTVVNNDVINIEKLSVYECDASSTGNDVINNVELSVCKSSTSSRPGNAVINNKIPCENDTSSIKNSDGPHCSKHTNLNNIEKANPFIAFFSLYNTNTTKEVGSKHHQCTVCNTVFTTGSSLKVHLRTHTKEKPFECTFCLKRFTRNSLLKVHLRTHTKEKSNYHKNYKSQVHIERKHEHRTKTEVINPSTTHCHQPDSDLEKIFDFIYKCEICGNDFNDYTIYKNHVATHELHENPTATESVNHSSNCHQSVFEDTKSQESTDAYFKCQICGNEFNNYAIYKLHVAVHELYEDPSETESVNLNHTTHFHQSVFEDSDSQESTNIDYKCEVCGNEFNDFTIYKNHAAAHELLENPTETESVNHSSNSHQSVFEDTESQESTDAYFKCQICGNEFNNYAIYKLHIAVHELYEDPKETESINHTTHFHQSVFEDSDSQESTDTNYKCEVCGNEFNDFTIYKNHAAEHESQVQTTAEYKSDNRSNDFGLIIPNFFDED
ncbi:zinc finger protein 62-like [Teleopsis dalmanni]|uniref:zinc finger protein 62-like n=1 Tax=Teleopsis dalmanni TaxID=139649 RepID=UPI0018CE92C4|nr:zinc finger protein 62-like [Teleopsis dalmanni]